MKRTIFSLLALLAMASCSKVADGEYILEGSIEGVDGKEIYLEKNDDSLGLIVIDTAKIENGKFRFQGKINEPTMVSMAILGVRDRSYAILETGEIEIEIDKDSTFNNELSGTYNNEQLSGFNKSAMKVQREIEAFKNANQTKLILAQNDKDTATIKALQADYMKLQKKMEEHNYKYIEDHPKSYVAALLIYSMFGPIEPDLERIQKYYAALDPELKKTEIGKKIQKTINEFKVVRIGGYAPDFTAKDPDGNTISMKKSMGKKLTLIDFWASWCPPCRAENPNLVAVYKDYKDKGFNIVAVSLDKPGEADRWKAAIAKDGLTWTHMSNLMHWNDPIAKQYGVEEIPQNFLVNEYGVIMAKNLHGDALRAKVREFLDHKK